MKAANILEYIETPTPVDIVAMDKELERLLNIQRDIEAQIPAKKASSMRGEIPRAEYEHWKSKAMHVKKRVVARYRELKELKKHLNREGHTNKPGEHTALHMR